MDARDVLLFKEDILKDRSEQRMGGSNPVIESDDVHVAMRLGAGVAPVEIQAGDAAPVLGTECQFGGGPVVAGLVA